MAHVVADRVRETTTTTGTGTYTLAGAVTGFETFGSVGNSNTTYYCCTDGTDFEVGVGTYTSSGTTLARTTILQSSNSDNAVNWSSGTRQIFCTLPAEKSVILDSSGDLTLTGASYNVVWDKSANALKFGDDAEARFGTGNDLKITHDGNNSIIADEGTGSLFIRGNVIRIDDPNSDDYIVCTQDGSVDVYHNGSKKFETASDGISVTGDITAKTSDGAILKLQTSDTTVADGDVIGAIEFSAPDEASGTDAITTAASIVAEADDTFAADNNKTDLVIKLGKSEAAVERARFNHEGGLQLTGYDTDANPDPSLSLRRDTASPADADFIGSIYFQGKNSADAYFTYGAILAVSNDVTNGTEDGKLIFRVGDAGTEAWSGSSNNLITLTADTIAFDASSGTTFGGHSISNVSTLRLTSTTDLSLSSTGHAFQVGSSSSTNVAIDNNEIMARNNGATSDLYLNNNGGLVRFGGEVVIPDAGTIGSVSDTDAIAIASDGQVSLTQDLTVKTSDGALLKLQTSDTTVADGNVIGAIEFSAPNESSGTDAITTAASIVAEADATFSSTVNKTDMVFKLGESGAASEVMRLEHEGNLTITADSADANGDPTLNLYRNSSSPADNDNIGKFVFSGRNDNSQDVDYFMIKGLIADASDGSEDGKFELKAQVNGSNTIILSSSGTTLTATGEIAAASLDISGDVDVDGTLEADAMTLNGTAITTTATLSTGISNNNVPKFTSGVADNDFLRVDGTAIEGRSASEVLSDIGGTTASDAANEATALAIALG